MYQNILCPVDGSDASLAGRTEAIKLAKLIGSRIRFMYIVDTYVYNTDPNEMVDIDALDNAGAEGKKMLQESVVAAAAAGVAAEPLLLETSGLQVAEAIVYEAKSWPAHLIVMGTHGRKGLTHMVMGSDAEGVMRSTSVPVLLARHE
jgi:nucleotide-binding universal stress UspA family protein